MTTERRNATWAVARAQQAAPLRKAAAGLSPSSQRAGRQRKSPPSRNEDGAPARLRESRWAGPSLFRVNKQRPYEKANAHRLGACATPNRCVVIGGNTPRVWSGPYENRVRMREFFDLLAHAYMLHRAPRLCNGFAVRGPSEVKML